MNLAAALLASAEKNAGKTAVFWGDTQCSYELLLRQSQQLAGHLRRQLAIQPGDRIGLWMKNCPEFIASLFGILYAGGVAAPINSFLKPDEVNHIIKDAGIDVVITDSSMEESLPKLRRRGRRCGSGRSNNLAR